MIFLLISISTRTVFIYPGDSTNINLENKFIITGSDSIWTDEGLLIENSLYAINYETGYIRFENPIEDTLKIRFSYLDIPVKSIYRLWTPDDSISTYIPIIEEDKEEDDRLIIRGNKGIFVEVSESGNDISQSLWMRLGGYAGNFKISGVISDENIPRGIDESQNIREVDKIYVEANSPDLTFRLGDIETRQEDVNKRILGLKGNWNNLEGAVGVSRGKYGKYVFRTKEGNHGPYRIETDNPEIEFSIVRGSEQVYLNNKLLKPGIDNQYTIDYSEGTITFSPSVFIDNETTVLVLFQYHPFGEENLFSQISYSMEDFNFQYSREKGFTDRDRFDEIYPDSGLGYIYTSSFVGSNRGDYTLEDSIFVYKGRDKGDYFVQFDWVGEGRGDYIYIDSTHSFLWTGDGPWSAKKKVDLPAEDNLVGIDINKNIGNIKLKGNIKARRYRTLFGGQAKDGVSGNISTSLPLFKIIDLKTEYRRRTAEFELKEWEGDKNLLNQWELKEIPPEMLTLGISSDTSRSVNVEYLFGITDTLRRNYFRVEMSPLYFKWNSITELKRELTIGSRWEPLHILFRGIKRKEKHRNELILESKPLSLDAGLEGRNDNDTTGFFTIRSNLKTGNTQITLFHRIRKNLIDDNYKSTTNGMVSGEIITSKFQGRGQFGLSRKRAILWERYYREVESGEGNYSYDSTNNAYFRNPYGNYVLEIIPAEEGDNINEYTGKISLQTDYLALIHGFADIRFRPELFLENNIFFNLKVPSEGKRRFFLKLDSRYLDDRQGIAERKSREKHTLRLGIEETGKTYYDYGLFIEQSTEENILGPYFHLWKQNGLDIEARILRIQSEDTIYTGELITGIYLNQEKIKGSSGITVGYNYYREDNLIQYRIGNLHPPGFYFDLRSSLTFDITKNLHFIINGNIRRLYEDKIYYKGRIGISADFMP